MITNIPLSFVNIAYNFELSNFKFFLSDIILFILLFLFIIVAYVKVRGKNFINRLSISIVNYSYSDSFYNEKNIFLKLYGYLLIFVFFISYSLIITISIEVFYPELIVGKWVLFFIIILLSTFIIYVFYNLFFLFFGSVFFVKKIVNAHLFYISNLLKFAGIVSLFLVFSIYFTNFEIKIYLIYLAIALSLVFYFLKILRSIVSFIQNEFSILYLFLYFCAVEIIPVMLLVKILLFLIEQNTII